MQTFIAAISSDQDAALTALLTKGPAHAPSESVRAYLSGPHDQLFSPEPATAAFLAGLFHHIVSHGASTQDITLCGSDLFHAHCFVDGANVGLIFHAKEHPKEFTLSSQRINEVGSDATGGSRDPRIGTRHSTASATFSERNFLWLASTNTIYLLLPHEPSFPTADLLSEFAGYQFATVDESAFSAGGPIMDVNYLSHPPAEPNLACRPENVLCAVYAPRIASLLREHLCEDSAGTAGPVSISDDAMTEAAAMADAAADTPAAAAVAASDAIAEERSLDAAMAVGRDEVSGEMEGGETEGDDVEREVKAALAERSAHAQRRTHQIDATLRFERLLRGRPVVGPDSHAGHWVVLVGGEFGGAMHQDEAKTRPGAWLGNHTSLQAIGRAFEALLPTVGRERIIVIAQLRETLQWLEAACESEEACERVTGASRFLHTLRGRLADTRRDCAVLIAHGGSDYDFTDVNPSTVLHVLGGDADATKGKPVVPTRAASVFTLLNSHGNAHPRHLDKPGHSHGPEPVHLTLFCILCKPAAHALLTSRRHTLQNCDGSATLACS